MRRSILLFGVTLALCLSFCAGQVTYAGGLSTGFGEVKLENLEPGKTYSTKEVAGLPLVVANTGDEPVDLVVEVLFPEPSELKEGYAPIPDLSWIQLEKTSFNGIGPQESATTDVTVSIPDDAQYIGKRYQVYIWSHTVGKAIGVGLKSRLLFTIKEAV